MWAGLAYGQTVALPTLQRNGSADIIDTSDGAVLRLVDAVPFDVGSAFISEPRSITSFSTIFEFRITESTGADGLMFVIQPISSQALGLFGGGLGYGGVTPSVGVEFDIWFNPPGFDAGFEFADPDGNHVGVNVNGSPISVVTTPGPADIDSGVVWTVWIDYRETTLQVRMSSNGVRPAAPLLSHQIDIPAVLGTTEAFVGFSAGTGTAWANHDVLMWSFVESVSIETLIDVVTDTAMSRGLKRSLLAKLSAAQAADERGNTNATCGSLGAFMNQLASSAARQQLSGSEISRDAVALMAALGCNRQ
jgi:hypothetical protein